jgi:alpha-mannosidase
MWASAAMLLTNDYTLPGETLDEAWKLLLLNQFHDILPGSSIHRVYEEAEADYAQILTAAGEVTDAAMGALVDSGKSLVVFNSLSWQRDALIEVPAGQGVVDAEGTALPVQPEGGRMVAEVKIPACGWTTVTPSDQSIEIENPARATDRCLENDLVKVSFDDLGRVTSIFDKKTQRELTTGPCNEFRMFKDVPNMFDAWDIDSNYTLMPIPLEDKAQIEVAGDGPLVARLRITRQLNASTMTQVVSLRRGSRRVDFETTIEWTESHKLLKVAFPVDYRSEQAIHEIQFGHLRRPTHSNRPFDFDQFEVANYKWTALAEETRGFAVLNDCKYGVDVAGNTISLTLLKSALAPDMTADKGTQQFTYAMYCWNGSLGESGLVREGYELNVEPRITTGQAARRSLFAVDADNVIIETVKPAEDGSGDVVVRLYEAMRSSTRCTLTTTLPVRSAAVTDMLEQQPEPVELKNSAMTLQFKPFEIKTVRLGR